MTTFTVPSGVSSEGSREQPAAARAAASRTGTRRAFIVLSRSCSLDVIVRGRGPVGSAEQVGHVHRDRAGGAAGGAGAAVPALRYAPCMQPRAIRALVAAVRCCSA